MLQLHLRFQATISTLSTDLSSRSQSEAYDEPARHKLSSKKRLSFADQRIAEESEYYADSGDSAVNRRYDPKSCFY